MSITKMEIFTDRNGEMVPKDKLDMLPNIHQYIMDSTISPQDCLQIVETLIQDEDVVNCKDSNGVTPLMLASKYELMAVVSCLLQHEADVKSTDKYGHTALHYLVKIEHEDVLPCIHRILTSVGANIDAPTKNWETPLMLACEHGLASIVNLLLNHRADINVVDSYNRTVFHYIVKNKHVDVIPCIIQIAPGFDIDVLDDYGETPLMSACRCGLTSVVSWLMDHGANGSLVDVNQNTILHYSVKNQHENIIICIERIINSVCDINVTNKVGETPLMLACHHGLASVVTWLLDHETDVESIDANDNTMLHHVVRNQHEDIIICIARLITSLHNINIPNKSGETPLMLACLDGRSSVITWLLSHGSDVRSVDKYGNTVLHFLVKNKLDNIVSCLNDILNADCDINTHNKDGVTPLMLACQYGLAPVVIWSLDHGADLTRVDTYNNSILHFFVKNNCDDISYCMERVIKSGCDVSIKNEDGKTPLYVAIEGNKTDLVKLLLSTTNYPTSDLNTHNIFGKTPLYEAVKQNNQNIVNMLITANCDVNISHVVKGSPFINSLYNYLNGWPEITFILLNAGCKVKLTDEPGLKVLHQAARRRDKVLIDLLIKQNGDALTRHQDNKLQLVGFILSQNDLDSLLFYMHSGLFVNTITNSGENILHLFAKFMFDYSYFDYHRLLNIEKNVNLRNNVGNTPMMLAAFLNNKPYLEFLFQYIININEQNEKGHTALHLCVIGFTFIKETLNKKVLLNQDVTKFCMFNFYPLYIQCFDLLIAAGIDINLRDNRGKTVLMLAAKKNDRKLVRKLLDCKADLCILDNSGRSVLQYLDLNNNVYDLACFQLLLSTNGGHRLLNTTTRNGNTLIQNALLFPPLWEVIQSITFIGFLVANNVSLQRLKPNGGTNYYGGLLLNEFNSEVRNELRKLLCVSGAPYSEVIQTLDFNTEESNGLGNRKDFCVFCNELSLKSHCRRVIRRQLGLNIHKIVLELEIPTQLIEFLLLKDRLSDVYFSSAFFDDNNVYGDKDDYNLYDLVQDDEDYHYYDEISHYNLLSSYKIMPIPAESSDNLGSY